MLNMKRKSELGRKIRTAVTIMLSAAAILSVPATAMAAESDGEMVQGYGTQLTGEISASVIGNSNPFTPEGAGEVMDNATESDGKEFFSITTESGSTFFLVIDRERAVDNVYLLKSVSDEDLEALATSKSIGIENGMSDLTGSATAISVDTALNPERNESKSAVSGTNQTDGAATDMETAGSDQEPGADSTSAPETAKTAGISPLGGNKGLMIVCGVVILLTIFVGYYVKVLRPKKLAANREQEDEDDGISVDDDWNDDDDEDEDEQDWDDDDDDRDDQDWDDDNEDWSDRDWEDEDENDRNWDEDDEDSDDSDWKDEGEEEEDSQTVYKGNYDRGVKYNSNRHQNYENKRGVNEMKHNGRNEEEDDDRYDADEHDDEEYNSNEYGGTGYDDDEYDDENYHNNFPADKRRNRSDRYKRTRSQNSSRSRTRTNTYPHHNPSPNKSQKHRR
jgi:hypothetical protein